MHSALTEASGYSSRGISYVEHIVIVHLGDDQGMGNCEQSFMIQQRVQHEIVLCIQNDPQIT